MIKNKKIISLVLSASLLTNPLILNAKEITPDDIRKAEIDVAKTFIDTGKAIGNGANNFVKGIGNGFLNRFKGMSAFTGADMVENATSTTFFGGSYSYSFNNSVNEIRPWLDWEAPGVKAGCNGFSLNLGFINLLDLEEIGEQLGGAAGAVLWGLLVGLVNSMPTLEHTFSKIKEWISNLQNMIRNACNFTSQMTTQAIKKGLPQQVAAWADKPDDLIDKGVDKLKSKFMKKAKGNETDPLDADGQKASKNFEAGYSVFYFVRGAAGDFLFNEFKIPDSLFSKMGSSGGDSEKADKMQIVEEEIKDTKTDNRFDYLLFVNLFGEFGLSPRLIQHYKDYGNIMSQLIAYGKIKDGKTKTEQKDMASVDKALDALADNNIETAKTGSSTSENIEEMLKPKYLPSPSNKVEMINSLLEGNKDKKLKFYTTKIIHAQVQAKSGKMLYLLATESFNKDTTEIKWQGLVNESRDIIECFVKESDPNTCAKKKNGIATLIVPGSGDIINTIKLQNKVEDANFKKDAKGYSGDFPPATKDLIETFANYNAYLYAKYLLQNMMDKKYKNSATNEIKQEEMKEFELVENILKDYLSSLENKSIKNIRTIKEFKGYFREIKEELQKDRIKK